MGVVAAGREAAQGSLNARRRHRQPGQTRAGGIVDRVANDGEVGLVRKVPLRVTVHHRDLPLREERGHRRINILVRAGDGKAPVLHGGGSRGHGGATDAGKMNRFDFRRKHSGEINHEDAQAQSFLVPNGFAVRGRKIL